MSHRHPLMCIIKRAAAVLGASLFALSAVAQAPAESALADIQARGRISFGVYNNFPPFHKDGRGIDVDLANALAAKLGLKASIMGFEASDENMEDDLRNMVWKGHYLGWGPADVLMHVPATSPLMNSTPQVSIFAPYHTVSLAVAFDRQRLPRMESLADLGDALIGVEQVSISSVLVGRQDGGKYTGNLRHYRQIDAAVADLRGGKLGAVLAQRAELEALLQGDARYQVVAAPFPVAPQTSWPIGLAVKRASRDLAAALTQAMSDLARSGELARIFAKYGVTVATPAADTASAPSAQPR